MSKSISYWCSEVFKLIRFLFLLLMLKIAVFEGTFTNKIDSFNKFPVLD